MRPAILLIDDQDSYVKPLAHQLREQLGAAAHVEAWVPDKGDKPIEKFDELLHLHDVRLVVTDYDLTGGQLGFFGSSVVDWCQNKAIPVGDFSRGHPGSLPQEPNMFELRVPIESNDAAANYVSAVFRGFTAIRSAIDETPELMRQRSPAAVLAVLLGQKRLESQFAQYGIRYGGANSALVDRFAATASPLIKPEPERVASLLTYITGHLLANAILRFPGPILDEQALAAYLAVNINEASKYKELFATAEYKGPFSEMKQFHWTHLVDEVLGRYDDQIGDEENFKTTGSLNRRRLEIALNTTLARPTECERCKGEEGGFYCPFTKRPVCQRSDCSVVSNVWIPAGARLARFERDFYDEWAPILGM